MVKTGYPSIDKTHLQGIPEEKLHPEILPVSMLATFAKVNDGHFEEPAIETDGKIYTKQMLKDDTIKFAGWLLENGLAAGDRIIIVAPNSYEGVVATFGANAIGIKIAVIKPITKEELGSFYEELDRHHPKMILFYDDPTDLMNEASYAKYAKVWLVAKSAGFREAIDSISISLETVMKEIESHSISKSDEPMLYLKTSGSSSKPKTLPFSNRAIFASLIYAANSTGTSTRDESVKKALCQASYYHGYGWMPLFVNIMGGNPVILAGPTPEDIANYYKLQPSYIYGSPLTLKQFMKLTPEDADISMLVAFFCAGASLYEKDYEDGMEYFRKHNCQAEIRNNYGISEGLCIGTVNDNIPHVPNTAGKFYIGPEWLVVDENGNEVKYGEVGEAIVAADSLCQGYLGDEELTKKHFIQRDGKTFFKTGDFLSLDETGYVSFVGRERRFFIIEGIFEKVNCETVEEAIARLDGVYQNAVIVTPDETGAKAFVVLDPNSSAKDLTEAEFRKALSEFLNDYQMPREIVFVDEIPMMSSGKVDYKLLETM
ncbi:acyl--CoA ligase [Candidatus Saccharibacteria bacterium]|nr:acyl--CoA ligase [Candidatus Saccharibacteria bacterium]